MNAACLSLRIPLQGPSYRTCVLWHSWHECTARATCTVREHCSVDHIFAILNRGKWTGGADGSIRHIHGGNVGGGNMRRSC